MACLVAIFFPNNFQQCSTRFIIIVVIIGAVLPHSIPAWQVGIPPWPHWETELCFVGAWLKCSLQGNSRYLPSLRDQGQHSTLVFLGDWIDDMMTSSVNTCRLHNLFRQWCLRHQANLRGCLKCVLIEKQLSNNWAPSALQVNAREAIATDRRVAPMADAFWSPGV